MLVKPTLIQILVLVFSACAAYAEKPNFIIIIGDDISWNDWGCYGHPTIRTPNVDKLASQGIKFTNTFLTASSCSPSRCSIMSGRYPHNNGAAELHTPYLKGMASMPGQLKKEGYYTASAGKWHMGENLRTDFDRIERGTGALGGEENWNKVLQERPKEKPFFMWFAALDAHRIWHADEWGTPHTQEDAIVPPYLVDTPETRQDLASYYNEVSRMDHYVGMVRKELEKQGVSDNTIIIVMADNGRPFPRSKTRVYDSGMKTPFVVYWPEGITQKGSSSNSLISVIDIAPTVVELAGGEIPVSFQGKSFASVLQDPSKDFRQYVFSEHNWHDYEAHERMVRSKDYLYVLNSRPQYDNAGPADSRRSPAHLDLLKQRDALQLTAAQSDLFAIPRAKEELFNVVDDPEQVSNIADNSRFNNVLLDFRKVMELWRLETKDNTPDNLTPDKFSRDTGQRLGKEFKTENGEMPGVGSGALDSNTQPGF